MKALCIVDHGAVNAESYSGFYRHIINQHLSVGTIRTYFGFVALEEYTYDNRSTTYLEFCWQGKYYRREFNWSLTRRSAIIRARRLAYEIAEGRG